MNDHDLDLALADFGAARVQPTAPPSLHEHIRSMPLPSKAERRWLPQSPKWRFQSMFSATKLLVAGAILALFGGFLLSGVLTQPSEDRPPAVGASATATTQADPSDGVTSEPEPTITVEADTSTTAPDLLPGVDLVTEEVEPGLYRVVSDGIRDLDAIRDVAATPAGDIWVELGKTRDWRVVRLGDPTVSRQFGRKGPWQLDVNADGSPTMDGTNYLVFDGEAWIKSAQPERVVEASPDGCWGILVNDECFIDYYGAIARFQDGEPQLLTNAEKAELGLTDQQGVGWIHHRHPSDGARWLMVFGPNGELEGLLGSGTGGPTWVPFPASEDGDAGFGPVGFAWDGQPINRPQDASVWIPGVESDGLVITRWDGETWSTYGPVRAPEPSPNGIRAAFRPDGSLWFTTGGRFASGALYVITPEAVAAAE